VAQAGVGGDHDPRIALSLDPPSEEEPLLMEPGERLDAAAGGRGGAEPARQH
jgi:hypothetical protein